MGDPGFSLFDQKHLTVHLNNDEEEDEAAIRYAKEKDDEIKEELARAFLIVDDDDEDDHEGQSGSSSSDEEEGYPAGNIVADNTKGQVPHHTNGLIFNSVSDNSRNLLSESDLSRNTLPERPALANGQMFSPSRRESSGFIQTSGGNMEYLTVNGGKGDGNHHFQTWSNANNYDHRGHFEKSLEESVGDYRQVNGGRGDADEHLQMWNGTNYGQNEQFDNSHGLGENEIPERYHQQGFSNNSHDENSKPFKPIFSSDVSKTFEKSDEDYILAYKHTEDNVEQLRVLLDVQERELKRLTEQLETERQQSARYKNEMFRKCALMEGEKERALLSRDELSKLLVSSKEQINMLQTEVQSLKDIIAAMEKNKKKSEEMEELGRIQIQELEERIAMMERCDPSKNLAKQQDMMVKELKNKHQQDVVMLQKQIETLNKKLLQKEEDYNGLEKRMAELQREHEMLLVDKGNTINQLSRQLDESQAQCRQLMAANVSVENVRLQNQLDEVVREKERLNETVKTLQIECSMMRSELTQYETVSRLNLPQSNSSGEESDSIVQLGMSSRQPQSQTQPLSRTNLNQTDTISKLKAELNRSFLNQKAKRAEIQRLTQIVNDKEDQVQELVKRERVYVAQFETLNDQLNKMKAEFKCLKSKQEKIDSCDRSEEISNLNTVIAELRKEKVVVEREKLKVQQELEDLKKHFEADKNREISDHNKEYLKFHDQTVATVKKEIEEKAELRVKEYSIRLEQSLKELSEVKEMYLSVCTAKEQLSLSLQERSVELGQVAEEKERLTAELQELTMVRDQLARRLNERETPTIGKQTGNKKENEEQTAELLRLKAELQKAEQQINSSKRNESQLSAECKRLREELSVMSARLTANISSGLKLEQVAADKDRLAAELQEVRDQLAHRLTEREATEPKEENEKLNAEILRLRSELQKAELQINTSQRRESQLSAECERLREDLSAMSARHTLEISSAREELRDSRERVIQLEKNARTQFETEMKSLRQDRDMLKTKCDEKEAQIMKLIESRKRGPAVVTVATETEDEDEEKQQRELVRCQEEYNRVLVDMEHGHRQALRKLREEYNNERMALLQEHKQELQAVEEHTKQLTVKFFAEEMKKLEAKYVDEVSSVVENMQKSLLEKNVLVENLQQRLVSLEEEWREKLVALNREMEAEKEIAAQMMVQWAEEMKKIQEELARKEEVIENQRTKLAKARALEQRHREKLVRNNQVFQTQYKKKCDEFKEIFKEAKEEAFGKLKQLDKVYEEEIKKIQKKEEMRIKALEKKLQQKT